MAEYTIPNLKNACRILVHISECARPMGVGELSKTLSVPRTTTIRILDTLAKQGFLDEKSNKFTLGPSLAKLCKRAESKPENIVGMSVRYLARLTEMTGETSHIGIFSNNKILISNVCDSPKPLHAASRTGVLADLHCSATGKAILACLSENSPQMLNSLKLVKRTDKTIVSISGLAKELKLVRENGYAVDDEEYHEHVRCLAAPVFDQTGRIAAAIGITAPSVRFTRNNIPEIAKIVCEVSGEFSSDIAKI